MIEIIKGDFMENKFKNRKNEVIKKLNLPKEVMTGEPKITIIGKEEINIENHKVIIKFDDNFISLNSTIGRLTIEGTGLEILYIEEETIIVSGTFNTIYYGEKSHE